MKYKVGQVLYLVPQKQATVYPLQVIEELTKKTLAGVEVDYVLQAGGTEPKVLSLKDVKGEVFESAEKAKTTLIERAVSSVTKLVENAVKKSQEWYPGSFEESAEVKQPYRKVNQPRVVVDEDPNDHDFPNLSEISSQQPMMVDMGNGVMAKVKLPDVLKG